ncbi:unnamed protein product [Leuciscus chuanchicus]
MHQSSSSSTKPVTTIRAKPPSCQDKSAKPSLGSSPLQPLFSIKYWLNPQSSVKNPLEPDEPDEPQRFVTSPLRPRSSVQNLSDGILSTTVSPAQKRRLRRKKWFSPECPEGIFSPVSALS